MVDPIWTAPHRRFSYAALDGPKLQNAPSATNTLSLEVQTPRAARSRSLAGPRSASLSRLGIRPARCSQCRTYLRRYGCGPPRGGTGSLVLLGVPVFQGHPPLAYCAFRTAPASLRTSNPQCTRQKPMAPPPHQPLNPRPAPPRVSATKRQIAYTQMGYARSSQHPDRSKPPRREDPFLRARRGFSSKTRPEIPR